MNSAKDRCIACWFFDCRCKKNFYFLEASNDDSRMDTVDYFNTFSERFGLAGGLGVETGEETVCAEN